MHRANVVWTNFCRFALGIVFIFSGFVKADDPYGMVYKLQDYFVAFGWTDFMPSFMPLFLSCLLAVFEFTLGVYLFFGIRKRLTSIAVALVMLVMTPFTLYLAIANPVSDCGCFGDALKLTNWETFWKNIVLLVLALWLFKHYRLVVKFISKKNQWIISMYGILYSVAIVSYCIFYLPIFDFRPYYIGANMHYNPFMPAEFLAGDPDRLAIIAGEAQLTPERAREVMKHITFYPPMKHSYPASICGKACDTACYIHLERKGVLKRKFRTPFRKREAWKLSLLSEPK